MITGHTDFSRELGTLSSPVAEEEESESTESVISRAEMLFVRLANISFAFSSLGLKC